MNRFILSILFVFCSLLSIETTAQNYPAPSGLYCSCGPTLGTGNGSVDPRVAAKPFVKGILVRIPWELLEPTNNNFSWTLLDGQITAAKNYNKKISLGIGNGPGIPNWLYDMGAKKIIASVPRTDTIAVPWDSIYMAQWTEFVLELGNRYANDTTISLVYITHSTGNGFEMQLPFQSTPTLPDIGYTDALMIDSWKNTINAFNSAFPNHYLSNDFHPVNGSDAVADSVYSYATKTIGNRYGASAWWWTQKNAQSVYPSQYAISKHSAQNNIFTGVQFANNGTNDSAKFGAGGLPGALDLAITDKICYWEIWNEDILNPKFEALFTDASCKTTTFINEIVNKKLRLYPNPAHETITIYYPDLETGFTTTIYNTNGKIVLQNSNTTSTQRINISSLPPAMYIVKVQSGKATLFSKLFVEF